MQKDFVLNSPFFCYCIIKHYYNSVDMPEYLWYFFLHYNSAIMLTLECQLITVFQFWCFFKFKKKIIKI